MGSGDLQAFVAQLLEPVAEEALHDQGYNRTMRQVRWEEWKQRKNHWRMLDAKHAYLFNLFIYERDAGIRDDVDDPCRHAALNELRKALGVLLLTPAHDKASLAWKKRHKPKRYDWDTPEEVAFKDEVDRAIAEDETWLATHTVRRPNKNTRSH